MTSIPFLLVFALAFAGSPPAHAQITTESPATFAETYVGAPVKQTVTIQNGGDERVTLGGVKAANRLIEVTSFAPHDLSIAGHSSADVSFYLTTRLALGSHHVPVDFQLHSDSGTEVTVRGDARIFVQNAFDTDRPEIDLGVVSAKQRTVKSISLTSNEIPGIALKKVLDAPKFLAVSIADDGKSVSVATGDHVPWGISQGYLTLQTNSRVQPEAWVHYQLDMRGDVIPSQNPVMFSPDNVGAEQEETVRLDRVDGRTLHLASIATAGTALLTRVDDCVPAIDACKLLRLTLPADAPSGQVTGLVTLSFDGMADKLPIQVGGFRLAKGQKLKSLTENTAAQTSIPLTPPVTLDVKKAIEQAHMESAPLAPPPGTGPLLKWVVSHEAAIYGYVIHRGDSETGPFKRVNAEIIPTAKDDDASGTYQWRDTSAQAGKTYWYYIGLVENNGHKRKLSDPQKVVAK
jgi:hypothetical protein